MRKLFILLFTVVSIHSFSQGKFEINGKLSGFTDSTMLYLNDLSSSSATPIDSVMIINNQFHFSGSIKDAVKRVILGTKNLGDYKYFWLEPAVIDFSAEKGKFKTAIITGSKTQNEQDEFNETLKKSGKVKEESYLFIVNHPNSIVSATLLSTYASTWGKDSSQALYNLFTEKNKNTIYGQDVKNFLELNKNIKVGDHYANFTQPDKEGKNVSLSDFKGKVVLLEFWGSWCGPCRAGNPELVKTYNEFKNAGFEILGVAAENSKQDWLEAVQKDGLTWPNVTDLKADKNVAALMYGISYYPANFLIDKNGIIIAKDLRGEELRNKLLQVLNN